MPHNSVSVILPTYNEKGNIIPLVEEIACQLTGIDHEIIVVDDNSPDGTYQAVAGAGLPDVKAVLRTTDRGLARSIRCGIEKARGEVLIVMDSDFNHQPKYIPGLLNGLSRCDCVSASRYVDGGKMDSRFRHFASGVFNGFVNLATGGKVKDNLYGLFAIKKSVLSGLDFDKIFIGYGDYYIRLLYVLQRRGVIIHEIPAVNGKRREGAGNRDLLKAFFQYTHTVLQLASR